MFSTLSNGTYSFVLHRIPTLESPRPSTLLVTSEGFPLCRFLLSVHLLEVEIGRYTTQQRELVDEQWDAVFLNAKLTVLRLYPGVYLQESMGHVC